MRVTLARNGLTAKSGKSHTMFLTDDKVMINVKGNLISNEKK